MSYSFISDAWTPMLTIPKSTPLTEDFTPTSVDNKYNVHATRDNIPHNICPCCKRKFNGSILKDIIAEFNAFLETHRDIIIIILVVICFYLIIKSLFVPRNK